MWHLDIIEYESVDMESLDGVCPRSGESSMVTQDENEVKAQCFGEKVKHMPQNHGT